jgi:hypothetical protein
MHYISKMLALFFVVPMLFVSLSSVASAQIFSPYFYYSSSSEGNAGGINFGDEDIIRYNSLTQTWSMFLDMSDTGITNDVDAFSIKSDESNTYLLSFDITTTVTGIGSVERNDIVKFVASSTGTNTAGTFSMYIDGSDIGLTTTDENINALDYISTVNGVHKMLISTKGALSAGGITAGNEDVVNLSATSVGNNTVATFAIEVDGSSYAHGSEDIDALQFVDLEGTANDYYIFSFASDFATGSISGNSGDLFSFLPSYNSYGIFSNASAVGLAGENVDCFSLGE